MRGTKSEDVWYVGHHRRARGFRGRVADAMKGMLRSRVRPRGHSRQALIVVLVAVLLLVGGAKSCPDDTTPTGTSTSKPKPKPTVPKPQADPGGPHAPDGKIMIIFTQKNLDAQFTWQHGMIAQDWHVLTSGATQVFVPDDGQYIAGQIKVRKRLDRTEEPKVWYISIFVYDDGGQILAFVQDGTAQVGKVYTAEARKGQ